MTDDRRAQLRRQWRTRLKYQRDFTADEATELRDLVGELLDEAESVQKLKDQIRWLEDEVEKWEIAHELDTEREELQATIDEMAKEQAERLAELAPALEDLHDQAHGGSWRLCAEHPCRDLYRILPNALGRLINT